MHRAHHVKLADAILAAVKAHADKLSTTVTVEEDGLPVLIVRRDSPNFGPSVEFVSNTPSPFTGNQKGDGC